MKKEVRTLKSTNTISTIHGVLYLPDAQPKALLQISHGMVEHIGRYDEFMTYMVNEGYAICGHDHVGHGQTVGKNEAYGFFNEKNGDVTLIDDLYAFGQMIKKELPSIPHILLGHSMGSFIARCCVAKYPKAYDGFIISGTGGANPASGIGIGLAAIIQTIRGGKKPSPTLDQLVSGQFNKKVDHQRTPKDWLSRDEAIVDAYINDPYSQFIFTASGFKDLAKLNKWANAKKTFEATSKTMPILLISGKEDPVGDYGKGVLEVYNKLKENGCQVTIILYDGSRHEILNEINRDQVFLDILNWVKKIA